MDFELDMSFIKYIIQKEQLCHLIQKFYLMTRFRPAIIELLL